MADDTTLVISGATYVEIATQYGHIMHRLNTASPYLLDAVNAVIDTDELYPINDLFQTFYQTYLINTGSIPSSAPFLSAVRTLNGHIIGRGGYADVNAFLAAKGVASHSIPQAWADLSASVGQTISSTYIGADSF